MGACSFEPLAQPRLGQFGPPWRRIFPGLCPPAVEEFLHLVSTRWVPVIHRWDDSGRGKELNEMLHFRVAAVFAVWET